MECCHSFITILDSRPWPGYPWHHYRGSILSILLLIIKSHTPSAVWRDIIWLLHVCTKCSLWMKISTSRWRLWEWFQTLLTCLLHWEKCQESTMYPALNMLHSTLTRSCHETCFNLHPDQYADNYHSVCQMTVTPQETSHQLLEQLHQVLKYA